MEDLFSKNLELYYRNLKFYNTNGCKANLQKLKSLATIDDIENLNKLHLETLNITVKYKDNSCDKTTYHEIQRLADEIQNIYLALVESKNKKFGEGLRIGEMEYNEYD